MVKRIIWSDNAKIERKEILDYLVRSTGNYKYSLKLKNEFNLLIRLLLDHPKLGSKVQNYNSRCLVKGDYKIFYEFNEDMINPEISILHIWDTRRDPEELNLK